MSLAPLLENEIGSPGTARNRHNSHLASHSPLPEVTGYLCSYNLILLFHLHLL